MTAYLSVTSSSASPYVTCYPDGPAGHGDPLIVVSIGTASLHLSPATAATLVENITRAVDEATVKAAS